MFDLYQKFIFFSNLLESGEILSGDIMTGKDSNDEVFMDFLRKIFMRNIQNMIAEMHETVKDINQIENRLGSKQLLVLKM